MAKRTHAYGRYLVWILEHGVWRAVGVPRNRYEAIQVAKSLRPMVDDVRILPRRSRP